MDILCTLRSFTRHPLLKIVYKINHVTSRNALDLAHKIHGSLGSTSPIIVLHGLLGSKKNWASMCKHLSANTSLAVVAADLRNHGESPHDSSHSYPELASDVSQLMNKLSINKANIIGHSMGGRTGMMLALTEPTKVLKLVVVDISPVSTAGILNNFFPRLIDVMRSIDFTGTDLTQARALAKDKIKASGLIDHEGMMAFLIMNVGRRYDNKIGWQCNPDTLKSHFNEIATFPDVQGKTFEGPVLFIGGEQSNYIPPADITGIRELFPKADLKYVKGVGHNVHSEDPATFLKMVTEFLK